MCPAGLSRFFLLLYWAILFDWIYWIYWTFSQGSPIVTDYPGVRHFSPRRSSPIVIRVRQVRKWTSSPYLPPPRTSFLLSWPTVGTQPTRSCRAGVTCSWANPQENPGKFFLFSWGRASRTEKWRRDLRLAP